MFSVDLIDDLFSEGGLEKVIGDLIKDIVAGNLVDAFYALLPYLIVFFIVYTVFKGFLKSLFTSAGGDSVIEASDGLLGGLADFLFGGDAPKESVTDKAQRLLGDGKYQEVARFLRAYIKSNPNDAHAKALYDIALDYSDSNKKSSYDNYGTPKATRYAQVKREDNNANYDSYDNWDSKPKSKRRIAELGADLVKQATGHKLTKEQMVHFAKTGKLPGQ